MISAMHGSPGHTSGAPATALMVAPRRLFQKRLRKTYLFKSQAFKELIIETQIVDLS